MTSALLCRWQLALRITLFSGLAGSLGVACCHCGPIALVNPQLDTLPSGCPPGSQPGDTTQLRVCLAGLKFDTTETVGDEQRLMVRESGPGPRCTEGDTSQTCRYGPLAKVEPVEGSHLYSDSALAQGRIIARMFLRNGETEGYSKFGLTPSDTTYWWVQTGKDSSYFVHSDSLGNVVAVGRPLERTPHPAGSFQQSLARWIWDPNDERVNGTCGSSCCKP